MTRRDPSDARASGAEERPTEGPGADVRFRPARPADAGRLSEIARRAKASWDYPESWLRAWAEDLTFIPDYIEREWVMVAERDGRPVGVVALADSPAGPEIGHLWIDPGSQGLGLGRALLARAVERARADGVASVRILSDPYARGFYERMGAVHVGDEAAPVEGTERRLPVLRLDTARPADGEVQGPITRTRGTEGRR